MKERQITHTGKQKTKKETHTQLDRVFIMFVFRSVVRLFG